jgi:2,3-bisphosphoglycerate-dependent phosphoglycerate mutase
VSSLLLIRHCQAAGQDPDAPLTAQGCTDAVVLARALAGLEVDALYVSPFERARATVAPFAAHAGLVLMVDARLAEQRLQGTPSADWMEHLRRSFEDDAYRAPGGETTAEARDRGLQALAGIAARRHACPAAVTHGKLLATLLRSMNPAFGFDDWRALDNPDLFEVTMEGGVPAAFRRLPWR